MTSHRQALGRWGEKLAADYLINKGYQILGSNLRTPYGEIDLLAQRDRALVFVEVKTRTSKKFGLPEEAITEKKMTHMIESAQGYLQENYKREIDWRIDVIAIEKPNNQTPPKITHFENVSF